jgi:hypothetical protein
MNNLTRVLWAGALLLCGVAPARADVLYSQPSDFPVSGRVGAWASQNDTAVGGLGNFATASDSFKLGSSASVSSVSWQGAYFGPPNQGPITAFTLTFSANNNGQPGAALLSEKIPGNANETFVGTEPGSGGVGPDLVFNYSTNLPTAFQADANTTYWLSIVPDLDFSDDPNIGQWGWHTATGGDGTSFQTFLGQNFVNPNDLAFTLEGTATVIPEPASLVVWGAVGLAGLGYGWRRRAVRAG